MTQRATGGTPNPGLKALSLAKTNAEEIRRLKQELRELGTAREKDARDLFELRRVLVGLTSAVRKLRDGELP